jgi:hypothetical protein
MTRATRTSGAPAVPDTNKATVEDWDEFKGLYETWVAKASDEQLLAEMAWLPEDGRPFSPSEAWMYHQCELRRRSPQSGRSAPAADKRKA